MSDFDWNDLAFGDKSAINSLGATFIAAPRMLSQKRLAQLARELLPAGNIVLGLAKESHVLGFEDQPQFRMLSEANVKKTQSKIRSSALKHQLYTLAYFQRETKYVLEKLRFKRVILVRGSWNHSFHHTEPYYVLVSKKTAYQLVSPFSDEAEAKNYATSTLAVMGAASPLARFTPKKPYSQSELMSGAQEAAKYSFDYTFQVGAVLAKKQGAGYRFITSAFNKVVPYQTYAMHHGSAREQNFSPSNDLNHYDTVHAEVELLLKAQESSLNIKNATLFINLMPCPTCARMLSETGIQEIVYGSDHSEGYALRLLEMAGKQVRRQVRERL